MSKLVILIPFPESNESVLKKSALKMKTMHETITMFQVDKRIDTNIDEIRIVYAEGDVMCASEDSIILLAFGTEGSTKLGDDVGGEITMNETIYKMDQVWASNARKAFFMVDHALNDQHIADTWSYMFHQTIYAGKPNVSDLYRVDASEVENICPSLSLLA